MSIRFGQSVTDKNVNKVFDEMLMFDRVLQFVYIPYTISSRLAVKSAKPVTLWYQRGISTCRNTRHTNVGDLDGLYGGQPARATIWGKHTLRCREMSRSEERASRFGIKKNFTREAP
ncbi:hypothetical protein B296_00007265 [Ensete ventricosum]|uniref:Uncharacterized protein n=1 Tax=Ensete ventricosum TaxID=4639 RepID=A0A427ACF7_ENSVE|nr:hypothetical protein B296_00007265 [Ensete ventricosum]